MTEEPWPDDMLARYLTPGGATVDVQRGKNEGDVTVTCLGCGEFDHGWIAFGREDNILERHTEIGKRWAQQHAERCRAIPRP